MHWLQPEPKEGMWGSKWVPFEVDVWTPKKSRTERVPWRSEYLDTECFVVSCSCHHEVCMLHAGAAPHCSCCNVEGECWLKMLSSCGCSGDQS